MRAKDFESQRSLELQKVKSLETKEQGVLRLKLGGGKMNAEIRVFSHTQGDEVYESVGRVLSEEKGQEYGNRG